MINLTPADVGTLRNIINSEVAKMKCRRDALAVQPSIEPEKVATGVAALTARIKYLHSLKIKMGVGDFCSGHHRRRRK